SRRRRTNRQTAQVESTRGRVHRRDRDTDGVGGGAGVAHLEGERLVAAQQAGRAVLGRHRDPVDLGQRGGDLVVGGGAGLGVLGAVGGLNGQLADTLQQGSRLVQRAFT